MWLSSAAIREPHNNVRITTVRSLTEKSEQQRREWLWGLVRHNLGALSNQLIAISELPTALRMWRISSELLPVATHSITSSFYTDASVKDFLKRELGVLGVFARLHGIRLSFHPGQFVVLGSKAPSIRANAMRELKYHATILKLMGYSGWHDKGCAINVHVGPKDAAVIEMRAAIKDAPDSVRNFLTLENEEFCWDADRLTHTFGDLVPVVLDIHHYWITHGKHLRPDDPLVASIRKTWRGERPKLHHASTENDLCGDASPDSPLNIETLVANYPKTRLRAHSNLPWHTWSNKYAGSFDFDIMWEGKSKNLGAATIAKQLNLIP